MFDLLLTNGIIITVDEKNRVIENGYVAIQDERIVEIGKIVMENRKMTLVDEKQALKNAQKSFEKMYARLNKDVMTNSKLYDFRMF